MRRSPAWMILGWALFLATLVWAQPKGFGPFTGGGGGLPSGAVYLIVSGTCPVGSTEVSALDGQMLRATLAGNADVGTTGGTGTITPSGTVSQPTLSMSAYTPQGSNNAPAFTGSAGTVAAQTITWPVGVPTFSGNALGTHAHNFSGAVLATHSHNFSGAVLATHSHNFSGAILATHRHETPFQLVSGTLLRFLGGGTFGVGTVRAAIGQITATANTTSTAVALNQAITAGTPAGTNSSVSAGTPAGTNSAVSGGTPAGTNSSVSGGTPAGTNAWPAGVPTAGSVNFTPSGSVSAPVYTGSQATLTGTVSQPTFSGVGFDPHPLFTRVIFCQVT